MQIIRLCFYDIGLRLFGFLQNFSPSSCGNTRGSRGNRKHSLILQLTFHGQLHCLEYNRGAVSVSAFSATNKCELSTERSRSIIDHSPFCQILILCKVHVVFHITTRHCSFSWLLNLSQTFLFCWNCCQCCSLFCQLNILCVKLQLWL